jgi:acyl carrier protein
MNNMDNIFNKIKNTLTEITNKDNSRLNINSTTSEIEGWDSITHIEFIITLENEFQIKFTASEMAEFKNLKELCEVIQKKVSVNQ